MTSICLYLNFVVSEYCKTEGQEYVLLSTSETKLDRVLDEMLVVREFLDVFPKDIPKFALERER